MKVAFKLVMLLLIGPPYGPLYGPTYGPLYGPTYGSAHEPQNGPKIEHRYGPQIGPLHGHKVRSSATFTDRPQGGPQGSEFAATVEGLNKRLLFTHPDMFRNVDPNRENIGPPQVGVKPAISSTLRNPLLTYARLKETLDKHRFAGDSEVTKCTSSYLPTLLALKHHRISGIDCKNFFHCEQRCDDNHGQADGRTHKPMTCRDKAWVLDTCFPVCTPACVHGSCTVGNKCSCSLHYVGSRCERRIEPCTYTTPTTTVHETFQRDPFNSSQGRITCDTGYSNYGGDMTGPIEVHCSAGGHWGYPSPSLGPCVPVCRPKCDRGTCGEHFRCECEDSYVGPACSTLLCLGHRPSDQEFLEKIVKKSCGRRSNVSDTISYNNGHNNGQKNGPSIVKTTCEAGSWVQTLKLPYGGPIRCSLHHHECDPRCLNGGSCVAADTCLCRPDFVGRRCEAHVCGTPFRVRYGSVSVRRSEAVIKCNPGYTLVTGSPSINYRCYRGRWQLPSPFTESDTPECLPVCRPPCSNGARCTDPGECNCPQGFTGQRCQLRYSEGADGPCVFPFVHRGQRHHSCTDVDHNQPWCATGVDNVTRTVLTWSLCYADLGFSRYVTTYHSNKPCVFPYVSSAQQPPRRNSDNVTTTDERKGKLTWIHDCVGPGSRPAQCPTKLDGDDLRPTSTDYCRDVTDMATPVLLTHSGKECVFPFFHANQWHRELKCLAGFEEDFGSKSEQDSPTNFETNPRRNSGSGFGTNFGVKLGPSWCAVAVDEEGKVLEKGYCLEDYGYTKSSVTISGQMCSFPGRTKHESSYGCIKPQHFAQNNGENLNKNENLTANITADYYRNPNETNMNETFWCTVGAKNNGQKHFSCLPDFVQGSGRGVLSLSFGKISTSSSVSILATTTQRLAVGRTRCNFPFLHKGAMHWGCITVNNHHHSSVAPSCPTLLDEEGSPITWGRCAPDWEYYMTEMSKLRWSLIGRADTAVIMEALSEVLLIRQKIFRDSDGEGEASVDAVTFFVDSVSSLGYKAAEDLQRWGKLEKIDSELRGLEVEIHSSAMEAFAYVLSGVNLQSLLGYNEEEKQHETETGAQKQHKEADIEEEGGEETEEEKRIKRRDQNKLLHLVSKRMATTPQGDVCRPFLYLGVWRGFGSCVDLPWIPKHKKKPQVYFANGDNFNELLQTQPQLRGKRDFNSVNPNKSEPQFTSNRNLNFNTNLKSEIRKKIDLNFLEEQNTNGPAYPKANYPVRPPSNPNSHPKRKRNSNYYDYSTPSDPQPTGVPDGDSADPLTGLWCATMVDETGYPKKRGSCFVYENEGFWPNSLPRLRRFGTVDDLKQLLSTTTSTATTTAQSTTTITTAPSTTTATTIPTTTTTTTVAPTTRSTTPAFSKDIRTSGGKICIFPFTFRRQVHHSCIQSTTILATRSKRHQNRQKPDQDRPKRDQDQPRRDQDLPRRGQYLLRRDEDLPKRDHARERRENEGQPPLRNETKTKRHRNEVSNDTENKESINESPTAIFDPTSNKRSKIQNNKRSVNYNFYFGSPTENDDEEEEFSGKKYNKPKENSNLNTERYEDDNLYPNKEEESNNRNDDDDEGLINNLNDNSNNNYKYNRKSPLRNADYYVEKLLDYLTDYNDYEAGDYHSNDDYSNGKGTTEDPNGATMGWSMCAVVVDSENRAMELDYCML